jgi:thioredoxin reductase (NADPH)
MNDVHEVIVIGGGPAGYTAALYAARANLHPLVFEGFQAGGQLMITSDVDNYPGFRDGILGPDLMAQMRSQAERFGTEFITDDVTRVDFSSTPHKVYVGEQEFQAHAVIVATGASARQLGLSGERALQGRGVSYCAVCDAAFFRGQRVIVVGGGDSAMEEATFLAKFASEVVLIHRRDEFRASRIMVDAARSTPNLEILTPYTIEDVLGVEDGKVSGVRLQHAITGEERIEEASGFFVAIGHDPNTGIFLDWLEHDANGYLVCEPGSTRTKVDGVFAAGDVQDHVYRQAVTAAGSGCMAALDAERWLTARARAAVAAG